MCQQSFGPYNRKCLRCERHTRCAELHAPKHDTDDYNRSEKGSESRVSLEDWAATFGVSVEEMLQSPAD